MKKVFLLLLLLSSVFVQAQSLKDALYSGKLKNQPGTVIRKGDDLTTKMDTASKAAVDTSRSKQALSSADSSSGQLALQADSAVVDSALVATTETSDSLSGAADSAGAETANAPEAPVAVTKTKSNTVLWKEYMNTVVDALKSEVLTSRKMKKGDYYVLVSYTIGTDGQVSIGDVLLSPEHSFLQQQIKDRIAQDPPRLAPTLSSSGVPRKVTKKYSFTLVKD